MLKKEFSYEFSFNRFDHLNGDENDEQKFYPIPIVENYFINKKGEVFNKNTNSIVKETINKTGYPAVTVKTKIRSVSMHVHRLLALTFIPFPKEIEKYHKLQVNHKNGIKTDYRLENLEWVTQQQNCDHAYRYGLRTDNKFVEIYDISSKQTVIVHSLGEAGRIFGVTAAAIHWQLNKKHTNIPYKGCWLKYAEK